MLVHSAFMQYMSAFAAQNMGAKKPERARKAQLDGKSVVCYLQFPELL